MLAARRTFAATQRALYRHAQVAAAAAAPTASVPQDSKATRIAGLAFFAVVAAGTASLGVWQSRRYLWKVGMIDERKRQLQQPVRDLPKDAEAHKERELEDLEFQQLRVEGKFKPGSTFYLYPRSAPASSTDSAATPKSGGYIYSLLERSHGTPVIVNRGWLPWKLLREHMARQGGEDRQNHTLVGVLRFGEERNKFTPDNDIKNRQFSFLDHEQMASAMGVDAETLPVMLDALEDATDHTAISLDHPQRKRLDNFLEFYMTPEKHLGYAVTWFSFSVAAIAIAFVRFRKKPAVRRGRKIR